MVGKIKPLLLTLRTIDNYAIDATGGGDWTDTQNYDLTVPVGKRWWVLGGYVNRDNSSTLEVRFYNATPVVIFYASVQGAATGTTAWPDSGLDTVFPFPLDAGQAIKAFFGTAQGSGAVVTAVVLEVDM